MDGGIFIRQFQNCISPNVPAVGDVLPARIRALRSKDQGRQNVPEQRRGNVQTEGLRAAE
jgi:hypothetical protein